MTPSEMEEEIRNLTEWAREIAQDLPLLATKEDLKAYATKEDLRSEVAKLATREDLKALAAKEDLRSTKDELKAGSRGRETLYREPDSRNAPRDSTGGWQAHVDGGWC